MSTQSNFPCDAHEFAGKRALVTGGTKGMGKAIVDRLRRSGATVITTARSVPGEPEDGVHFVQADLGTAEGPRRLRMRCSSVLEASTSWSTTSAVRPPPEVESSR